jgi:ribosome-binding factor A
MRERIKKVNQLILKEFSWIIIKEVDFPENVYVTLTKVETSVDLRSTRIYVSVLPETKTKQVLEILNSQIYHLQQKLNKRLNMRPVPKIRFIEERTTVTAGRIEHILENLKKNK